ncbi:hypothetical protein ACFQ21_25570 [Ohtaekwangia kribbensis]|uniref:Uncharacterized protein n=1 Tax=Ohtaekwangia kribbensis TaxID=688913 RepID=A0ABW3KBB9_9BACT
MNIGDYQTCFSLSYDQFIAQHNIPIDRIHENVRYEKVTNACRVDMRNRQFFFFQNGTLRVIYISDDVLAKKLWDEFNSSARQVPDETVRSRAGKTSNQLIFAGKGITASINKGVVDFIEIYPPCTQQDYLENIYHEPQRFIR